MTSVADSIKISKIIEPIQMLRFSAAAIVAVVVYFLYEQHAQYLEALNTAYYEIGVFVAFTLFLVVLLEKVFKTEVGDLLHKYPKLQVPLGAVLGATPGCGGAIVAVTQFIRGNMSFGSLVAALSATMGDAMFLLISAEPLTGIAVMFIAFIAGILTGYAVDLIHDQNFLRPENTNSIVCASGLNTPLVSKTEPITNYIWLFLVLFGMFIGIPSVVMDYDMANAVNLPNWVITLLMMTFVFFSFSSWIVKGEDHDNNCNESSRSHLTNLVAGTSFVVSWVVIALIGYEMIMHLSGFDTQRILSQAGPYIILLAILIGFIPGCGPQIVVTSMYIAGNIPLSAQIGNAIANDGDALFPALAIAPKASIIATGYSAIPALLFAYAAYLIGY